MRRCRKRRRQFRPTWSPCRQPTFNGAWVFTDSKNRKPFVTQKNIFLPRIGVAIRVNDKTAVNIGFARYVVPIVTGQGNTSANTLAACEWCPGFSQTSTPLPFVEGRPQAYLSNPFPANSNPLQLPIGKSLGAYTNVGNAANWADQNYHAQINDRINFTIMREIPGQFKVDATWFMNIGRYVPHISGLNMADPNLSYTLKAQLSQNMPNPFYNYLTPDVFPGTLRNQPTVTRGSLLRPYPHYGGNLTVNNVGDWRARYQALQLRVQRTYAAGASVLFAYNYNQERNEAYFNDPQQYVNQVFWLGSNNARHRLTIAGTYDFPIGKGRKFGSSMHPVLNGAFGGWQVSGIYTYRSGEFLRFGGQLDVIGESVHRQSRTAEVVQHRCLQGSAGVHSAHESVPVRRHHRSDLLERGRNDLQDVPDQGTLQARVPIRGLQPDQLADVGQPEHDDRQRSLRPVHDPGSHATAAARCSTRSGSCSNTSIIAAGSIVVAFGHGAGALPTKLSPRATTPIPRSFGKRWSASSSTVGSALAGTTPFRIRATTFYATLPARASSSRAMAPHKCAPSTMSAGIAVLACVQRPKVALPDASNARITAGPMVSTAGFSARRIWKSRPFDARSTRFMK